MAFLSKTGDGSKDIYKGMLFGIAGSATIDYMARDTGSSAITDTENPKMTPKEQRAFDSELRRMAAFDVREQADPTQQSDSTKRAMAVTEMERRRQARAPETIREPVSGRMIALIFVFILIAGAGAAYWRYFYSV